MNTKSKIPSVVLAILAGTLSIGSAQAAPVASAVSVVTFENFQIFWATGTKAGQQVNNATDFQSLSVTASLLTAANITGQTGISSNPSTSVGAPLVAQSVLGTVDPSITGIPATTTTVFNVPTLPLVGNFSASASNDVGAPILNFPTSTNPVQANADLHNASYASLDTLNGSAGTSTSSTLASTINFVTGTSGALEFKFDVGAYIGAYLSAGAAQSAIAGWSVNFTLRDTTLTGPASFVGFFDIGDSVSNNSPGSGITEEGGLNSVVVGGLVQTTPTSFLTDELVAGRAYQLSAVVSTRAQVERVAVPEPSLVALLGFGLLGMSRSLVGRRLKG